MELFLFGGAAIAAFMLVAGPVLLWAGARREAMLRDALAAALTRIDELESSGARPPPQRPQARDYEPVAAEPRGFELPGRPAPSENAAAEESNPRAASLRGAVLPIVVGAICTMIAVAALVAARNDALSPAAALIILFIAAAAALIGAELLHRARALAPAAPRTGIASLALLGFALILAACAWGAAVESEFEPLFGLGVFLAAAFAAIAAAQRYGEILLGFGLAAALVAPALFVVAPELSPARHALLICVLTLGIWLARARATPAYAWLVGVGAIAWAVAAAFTAGPAHHVVASGVYFLALAIIAFAYGWEHARTPLPFPAFWCAPAQWREPLVFAHILALAASAGAALLLTRSAESAPLASAIILLFVALAAIVAIFAEAYALIALASAALAAAAFALWPAAAPPSAPAIASIVLALVLILLGLIGMTRAKQSAPGAALAAFGALLALLAAEARAAPLLGREMWAAAALTLAALNLLFAVRLKGAARDRTAAEIFVIAAALAAATALAFLTPQPWRALPLALMAPALALADRRFNRAGLRVAAVALCAAALMRCLADAPAQPWSWAPWLPPMTLVALALAAAAFLSAKLFAARDAGVAQLLRIGAGIAAALAASILIRFGATEGNVRGPYLSLWEMGGHTLIWLGLAAALAWRASPAERGPALWAETVLMLAAGAHAIIVGGAILNPWWGARAAPAPAWPLLNEMALAYAAPAAAFFAYAWMRARRRLKVRAELAGLVGLFLALLWITLEIRRALHGFDMRSQNVYAAEGWALLAIWVFVGAGVAALYNRRLLAEAASMTPDPNLMPPR